MKQKSLTKVLTTVAVIVAMLLLASFALVGCGNNKNSEPPKVNPVNFDEYFQLQSYEVYGQAKTTSTNLQDLATEKVYKTIEFNVLKDIDLVHFSITANATAKANEQVRIAINFGNPYSSFIGEFYNFNNDGPQTFRYDNAGYISDEAKMQLKKDTTITILLGVGKNDTPTTWGQYSNGLKLSNFVAGI